MSFMISRETENVESIAEVEGAFLAITAGGEKPYVTREEIFQVSIDKRHMTVNPYLPLPHDLPPPSPLPPSLRRPSPESRLSTVSAA